MSVLHDIATEARTNSQRWFPLVHDADEQMVPLAAHYMLGLAGEVGEVANEMKKALRGGYLPEPETIGPELADVFIYLLLLADEVGVDLEASYQAKRDFNEQRWGAAS